MHLILRALGNAQAEVLRPKILKWQERHRGRATGGEAVLTILRTSGNAASVALRQFQSVFGVVDAWDPTLMQLNRLLVLGSGVIHELKQMLADTNAVFMDQLMVSDLFAIHIGVVGAVQILHKIVELVLLVGSWFYFDQGMFITDHLVIQKNIGVRTATDTQLLLFKRDGLYGQSLMD